MIPSLKLSAFFCVLLFLTSPSIAKKRAKRPPLDPSRVVELNYGNPAWNHSASKIDSATVVIKDSTTKKVVLLNLQEIGPDENTFRGIFSVSWGNASSLTPEVYIPSQERIHTQEGKEQVLKDIHDGKLKRKPFLLTRGERGQQVIEVFDTSKQAQEALVALREKRKLERKIKVPEEFAKASDLNMVKKEKLAQELLARKLEVNQAETERLRLLQIEQKKESERIAKEKALAEAEKKRRKDLAKKWADEGTKEFLAGNFQEAKEKFEKSLDYDPSNRSYLYAYGISLYRIEKFNEAIVVFQMISESEVDPIEKNYYLGMSYFRIKDFSQAHSSFAQVVEAKKEPISSSASFYQGLCYFGEKKWEPAKDSFQWVLDNSQDPQLDEQAESYIEQIARLQYFEKNQEKKHILTAGFGVQYDSNVLLQADNSANATASGKGDIRTSILAGYQWRPRYTEDREISLKTNFYYLRSLKAENETADPMLIHLSAPYVIKGKFKEKGLKSEIIPKLEQLYMFPSTDSNRKNILDTYGVDWKNTLVNSESHFSGYNLSLTQNNSHSPISSDDQNSDALKLDLYHSNTWFLDKKRTKGWVLDTGISLYNAKGKDQKYQRLDIAATYLSPIPWKDFVSIARANVYQTNYPNHSSSRKDTYITLGYNLQKSLKSWLSLQLGASYTKNSSSDSSKTYSKFIVNSNLSGRWEF